MHPPTSSVYFPYNLSVLLIPRGTIPWIQRVRSFSLDIPSFGSSMTLERYGTHKNRLNLYQVFALSADSVLSERSRDAMSCRCAQVIRQWEEVHQVEGTP